MYNGGLEEEEDKKRKEEYYAFFFYLTIIFKAQHKLQGLVQQHFYPSKNCTVNSLIHVNSFVLNCKKENRNRRIPAEMSQDQKFLINDITTVHSAYQIFSTAEERNFGQ